MTVESSSSTETNENSPLQACGEFFRNACLQCRQTLKDRTLGHVQARWVGYALLLSFFLARTLLIAKGFYIVVYGLGIHMVAQAASFWSPLNTLLLPMNPSSSSTRSVPPEERPLPQIEEEQDNPSCRRIPEFQVWFVSCRAVVVALFFTTSKKWFDVPVFWPILLVYFVGLASFAAVKTLRARWAAATVVVSHSDANQKVQIQLVPRCDSSPGYYSISSITPWSAIRMPPTYLATNGNISSDNPDCPEVVVMHPMRWRSFLRDVEALMIVDGKAEKAVLQFFGIFTACVFLGNLAFYALLRSPQFPCWDQEGCNRRFWASVISFVPSLISFIIGVRSLSQTQKQVLERPAERIRQCCDDFCVEHPHVSYTVKVQRGGLLLEIQRGGGISGKNKTTTSHDANNNNETTPNPETNATDPLLLLQNKI